MSRPIRNQRDKFGPILRHWLDEVARSALRASTYDSYDDILRLHHLIRGLGSLGPMPWSPCTRTAREVDAGRLQRPCERYSERLVILVSWVRIQPALRHDQRGWRSSSSSPASSSDMLEPVEPSTLGSGVDGPPDPPLPLRLGRTSSA